MADKEVPKNISDEEISLFRETMNKIFPGRRKAGKTFFKRKVFLRKRVHYDEVEKTVLSDHESEATVAPNERLFFTRSGISPKQIRKLKSGKLMIEDRLDLHGFDSESARTALVEFLDRAYKQSRRCIVIIHGKGHTDKPVLKNKINNWLRQMDKILAFATAMPKDGGTGALYVLLKSSQK